MKNINFDNPYWLIVALPLLLAVLIPYFIAKNKDNRSVRWAVSLALHLVIVASVTLAAAGLTHTTVMTRTKVYVLADLSHSSRKNLDLIDEYIQNVADELPQNSKMGVVCFGNGTEVLTSSGESLRSVRESKVDGSATDIAQAIDEVSTYFSVGELKRIVLITDGRDTTAEGSAAAAVERALNKGIQVDAIYLDNNLKEGEAEVQLSSVAFTQATYLNFESKAEVKVQSGAETQAVLTLSVKEGEGEYEEVSTLVTSLSVGTTTLSFALPTDRSGIFDYKIELSGAADTSHENDRLTFTQTVAGRQNVLLITEEAADIETFRALYENAAFVDAYLVTEGNRNIPYTVEDLAKYDEILLSNVDIRKLNNVNAFIDSADAVISQYGKSLVTFGDLHMQNTENEVFARFEELLPVSFGNANKDARLYTVVIDISRSMYYARPAQLIVAKDAATKLVSILDDEDYVSLVAFAGESRVEFPPAKLGDCREELYQRIQSVTASQGTFVGEALDMAYDLMKDLQFEEKQVMLLSDGKTYTHEPENATEVAEKMKNDGIALSAVAVLNHSPQTEHGRGCRFLSDLAAAGGGVFYELLYQEKVAELVFAEMGDNVTDAVVEGSSAVNVVSFHDEALEGILSLPAIGGYVNSKAKLDATMVLSVDYRKNAQTVVEVPLYSYREHGNGRVATFTSNVSGEWLSSWSEREKSKFFKNVLLTNTPKERVDYPFELRFEAIGERVELQISPSYLNPRAKAEVKITAPDGSVTERQPVFDLNCYRAVFDAEQVGKYAVEVTYSYGTHSFTANTYYTLSYAAEYDAFAVYDVASVYDFMRGKGQVSVDGTVDLTTKEGSVATYERDFKVPLLLLAAVLFVVDVFLRKFSWQDIKGVFRRSSRKKEKKEGKK